MVVRSIPASSIRIAVVCRSVCGVTFLPASVGQVVLALVAWADRPDRPSGSWVTPADALAEGDWARVTKLAAEAAVPAAP